MTQQLSHFIDVPSFINEICRAIDVSHISPTPGEDPLLYLANTLSTLKKERFNNKSLDEQPHIPQLGFISAKDQQRLNPFMEAIAHVTNLTMRKKRSS
jgi:hypothetical protein